MSSLSMLPEEITTHILSLMPTKYAARTSVLSKRWRCTWMGVENLHFDDDMLSLRDQDIFTKFVERVLKHYKSSQINLFRLHISNLWIEISSVSSWINEAVKLNVNELDIKVTRLGLPLSLLTCKTLTKLKLDYFAFHRCACGFSCQVNLPCLKTLDVVVRSDPFQSAFKLIGGCPIIESLSLDVRHHGKHEEDYVFNIPTLKQLKLIRENNASCINKVVLNVPNLEHLFVGGYLCSIFVMEDVSSLVGAYVSFGDIKSNHVWDELLKGLTGVISLSAQMPNFRIDYKPSFFQSLPIFPKVKHLELKGYWHSRRIPQLLDSFPELKHLCIERKVHSWVKPKLVPACMLKKLTTIKFSVCDWWRCDLPFLKYMLGNAEVLKTMAITWKRLCLEEEQAELCEELLKFPRASRCCEIQFHGN